ncbi:MAG TPA: sigma-70 family RNA polymerase sigma factor [Acidimicrobiia bacterium]|nr:sigma-70 family RNA polymerase sigma factor [Acidimicrobiia bacterium]
MNELQSSFAAFYNENYDSVCRGLSVALGDALLAEDAAQEAFTRAYVRWHRVSQMDRPSGWVYVTAVRVATRRRRVQRADAETAPVGDPADWVVNRASVGEAIDALPERQRLAIVLRYGLDLSLDDVASAMGCAVGTVKSTLYSALARLHLTLDDELREVERDASR